MITQFIIGITFAGILGWTLVARNFNQPTISMIMRDWAWVYSTIPYITGFIIAHWFFTRAGLPTYRTWIGSVVILSAMVLFDVLWFFFYKGVPNPLYKHPLIYLSAGCLFGYLFWPQTF